MSKDISSNTTTMRYFQRYKDLFFITFGILTYSIGYTAFILPEKVVMGGVAGISALLFYAFNLPPGVMIWVLNVMMLILAFKALNKQFVIRTVIGVSIMSLFVGMLQPFFEAHPIITVGEDKFMHVLIGGALGGAGLGIVFSHNGSTGGTDIIVALLNKYTRMSFGRAMQVIDCCIISSSYLLFHSTELIVYGVAFTIVASVCCDYVINGSRQTVQFLIISKKYADIARAINNIHRGVTVLDATGFYTGQEQKIMFVLAKKRQSTTIFRIINDIDPTAFVSQSAVIGVFGEGFDHFKVRHSNKPKETTPTT